MQQRIVDDGFAPVGVAGVLLLQVGYFGVGLMGRLILGDFHGLGRPRRLFGRAAALRRELPDEDRRAGGQQPGERWSHEILLNGRNENCITGPGSILRLLYAETHGRQQVLSYRGNVLLTTMAVAVPALADTQFRIRRMMRNDVPPGKGQCDIRLQVDQEAEVSVRGDTVSIRTIAGRDPRDDGSECNAPLPSGDVAGFNFEVKDSRGDIRLISEPSRRTGGAAVVHIRDSAGGEGRYHFRISWMIGGAHAAGDSPSRPPADAGRSGATRRASCGMT